MRFLLFGPEHASGALVRGRPGVLRKAFDSDAPLCVRAAWPQPFQSPLPGAARIAFRTHLFHLFPDAQESQPDLLVLPLNAALALTPGAASPASALVVITSVADAPMADAPMADHHRDHLWNVLGLPVFEQLTGWDGTVIARECEAHDGLHVAQGVAIAEIHEGEFLLTQLSGEEPVVGAPTGLAAGLNTSLCACGRDTPRLQHLIALPLKVMRARAAA